VTALLLGGACLGAFIVWEKRHPAPMLPLELFESRDFTGANMLTLLLYAALGGGLFFFPLNLIQVQGYSAAAAGAALLPSVLCMFLLSRWAGGLVERHGAKRPLVLGPLIAGCGFLLFAVPGVGGSYWTTFFPPVLVLGLGMAVSVAPLTTTVMSSVRPDAAGMASGVNNAVSRVAALLAVALFGIVMTAAFNRQLDQRLAAASVPAEAQRAIPAQRAKLAAIETPPGIDPRVRGALEHAVKASFVHGFRCVMVLSALLALAAAAVAWRMIDGKARPHPG
jgi:predicted MFS family arabinose efflux permease